MIDVKAWYNEETDEIKLHLTHNGETEEIISKIRPNGSFRFSYHHPELDEPEQYTGLFKTKSRFYIFPSFGKGVISNKSILIESEN